MEKPTATTNEAMRQVFDKAIEETTDPEVKATRELLREYFCNPDFPQVMADEIARINGQK